MNPYSMQGWGKGLQGAGDALMRLAQFYESRRKDKLDRDEQSAREKAAEEERKRRQAEADRLYNQNLEFKRFELGLEEAEPLERRLRGPDLADTANVAPMPEGWRGAPMTFDREPLEALAQDAAKRMQGGRSMTLTDASGKATRYVQPRDRTTEGRQQAEREAYFKRLEEAGYTPEQLNQLRAVVDAPQGLANAVLGIVRPEANETPWEKMGFKTREEALAWERDRTNATTRPTAGGMGGVAGRPPTRPTEAQEKSAFFYSMMDRGFKEMQGIENPPPLPDGQQQPSQVRGWAIQTALRTPIGAGNIVLNEAEQVYLRAAREFAAGVLRKESGAAVTPNELRDVFARYIEAPGDGPQVRAAKQAARLAITKDMERQALPASRYYEWATQNPDALGGGSTSGMSVDELIEFYLNGGR